MQYGEPTKAQLFSLDSSVSITMQFNPTSFKFGRKVNWAEGKNAGMPWTTLSFSYGGNDTLSISLLLDETEADSEGGSNTNTVLSNVAKFYKLTYPLKKGEAIRPPVVAFVWEQFQFQGVVESMDVEMLLFDGAGMARRAMVSLNLLGRAMSAASSSDDFFKGDHTIPAASGGSSISGNRLDALK